MNLDYGTIMSGLIGVLTIGISWGMVTTRLESNKADHDRFEKRMKEMDSEMVTEIKERCEKFEHNLDELERKCRDDRKACQESLWDYVKGPDQLPRYVSTVIYAKDKDAFIERLKSIENTTTEQHREIMIMLDTINKNTQ